MATTVVATAFGGPEVLELVDVDVPRPGRGQVTIDVRAAGVNPFDYVAFSGALGRDSRLPLPVGSEVAGVISAIGPETEIASGGGAVGDAVLAFAITGAYSEAVTVAAADVFAKPGSLDFPQAANLLLVGTTAADMLRAVPVERGETVLVHGASGAVGVSLLQLLRRRGVRAVGTASDRTAETVRGFGGEPIAYGDGLEQRARQAAPDGISAAFDCVGTDEAVDVSCALLGDRTRLVTIAAHARAAAEGFIAVGNGGESVQYRRSMRAAIIELARTGELIVPVARTYPLTEVRDALSFLRQGHPGGKLALIP